MDDTMTVESRDPQTADLLSLPSPRVEKAVDELKRVLAKLKERPADADCQQDFCLASRTAESFLQQTWHRRGGHYRADCLKRFVAILRDGVKTISENPNGETNENRTSDVFLRSISRRLEWVENLH